MGTLPIEITLKVWAHNAVNPRLSTTHAPAGTLELFIYIMTKYFEIYDKWYHQAR